MGRVRDGFRRRVIGVETKKPDSFGKPYIHHHPALRIYNAPPTAQEIAKDIERVGGNVYDMILKKVLGMYRS